MSGPNRFHVLGARGDAQGIRAALEHCVVLMRQRTSAVMGLAVHGKKDLDDVLRAALGESLIRALDRDNRFELKSTTTQLLTEKIRVRRLEGPVLAAFVHPEKLELIADCAGVADTVWVADGPHALGAYLARFPQSQEIARPT